MKKTIFISDLHLTPATPSITTLFLSLLKQDHTDTDALYILGDLFETWIGDDDKQAFHEKIIEALKSATQRGLPIYFLRGNRDFLIGKHFLRATGCQLLADEKVVSLYGTKVLLIHGDTLCTHDKTYLAWRKIARNCLVQWLFLHIISLPSRQKIANKMRAKSASYTQHAPAELMDVTQDEVLRLMLKHRVQFLIHGHTHKPAIHEFKLEQKPAARMVLDAWHERGNMLVWDSKGKKELVWFGD